jgi:hypothetical protein
MADQELEEPPVNKTIAQFPLGTYKTRAAAEAGLKLWLEIYDEEDLSIDFDGSSYRVQVRITDDPR